MPIGAFKLNSIGKYLEPSAPLGTGWGAYTGSQDGPVLVTTDTTFGIGEFNADLMNSNTVLVGYGGTANIANNQRIGRFTWDANNNLTYTFIEGMNRPNPRSTGNYITYNAPSIARLTYNPAANGYIYAGSVAEGTGGGNQSMFYGLYSYTTGSNSPTRLNSNIWAGYNGQLAPFQIIPVYGRVSSGSGRFVASMSGGGGSNNTNYVSYWSYNQSTGALTKRVDTGLNSGARYDDGNRHPIGITTELNASNNTDGISVTYSSANVYAPQRYFGDASTTSNYSSTPTWAPTNATAYNRGGFNKHHISQAGQQLFLWGNESGKERFYYGKARWSSETTASNLYFSTTYAEFTVTDATYNTLVDYGTTLPSTTEGISVFAMRNSGNTAYQIKLAAMNIVPQIGNTNTPSISSNGSVLNITNTNRNGSISQVKCITIDSNRVLVIWIEDLTKLCAKIIKKA